MSALGTSHPTVMGGERSCLSGLLCVSAGAGIQQVLATRGPQYSVFWVPGGVLAGS